MRSYRLAYIGGVLTTLLFPGFAHGADTSPNAVRAEALFDEGRRLMNAGDYAAGCPKFADSEALDPAPGTALNLAICYEKSSKYASAWAAFRTAEALARASTQKTRADLARRRAEKLQVTLSRLTVTVPLSSQVPGIEIRCDGESLPPPEWGVAVPHDGGAFEVAVLAPGKKAWTIRVELNPSGESLELNVPPLEDEPPPPPIPPPPLALSLALHLDEGPRAPSALGRIESSIAVANALPSHVESRGGTQRAVGLFIGAAGILGMGAAGTLGLVARSKFDTAVPESGTARGQSDSTTAFNTGNLSTVILGAGAIVTLVGAGVWLTAPKAAVVVGVNAGGVRIQGGF
jgi:hypothetical protein